MGFDTLTVPVSGGEIFATRRGMGEGPPALLLHGGPGVGAEMIIGLVEELDGLIDGVLPQQRGLHPSTLEGPRDVETHIADAIAILDHLGWDRAWMIGHAWGGHLAMHIAVAHPERVTGLIAIETLGAIPDGGSTALTENLVARLTLQERSYLDALLEREAEGDEDPGLMAEMLLTLWPSYSYVHGNVVPPGYLRLERPLGDGHDTVLSIAAHFEAGTLERGLPLLDLTALFLHGEGDPLPSRVSVETAALIRGARVEIIAEAGHFPWLERRGTVRAAVERMIGADRGPAVD